LNNRKLQIVKYDQNYSVLKNDEIEKQVFNKIEDRAYKKFGQHKEKICHTIK